MHVCRLSATRGSCEAHMSKKPKPEMLALLICESVIEDSLSKNKTIVSTFNKIIYKAYPARHDRLAAFLSMTGGHGDYELKMRIVHADAAPGEDMLLEVGGQVVFANPLAVVELTLDLRGLTIPRPGVYAIQVVIDGDVVKQRRFEASLIDAGGQSQ